MVHAGAIDTNIVIDDKKIYCIEIDPLRNMHGTDDSQSSEGHGRATHVRDIKIRKTYHVVSGWGCRFVYRYTSLKYTY